MKYCFIVNPAAGKGTVAAELMEKIRAVCTRRELDFEVYPTKAVGDATDYVKRTVAQNPSDTYRFYACGGDGTLGEAATGIMSLDNPTCASLGLFPIGTGHDFARNFAPKESLFDVEAQIDAEPLPIDVMRCNDRYSINMVNVGFDCEVVVNTVGLKRNPMIPSSLAYVAGLIGTLVRKPGVDMTITADGEEAQEKHLLLTTFANGEFCGGGFHSNPAARVDDGKIDVLFVNNVTRRKFISIVGDYKKGTHLQPKFSSIVENKKFERVDMTFPRTTNVSVDGEVVPCDALRLEAISKGITFLVPKGACLSQTKA